MEINKDLKNIDLNILAKCSNGINYSRHDYYAEATAGVKSVLPASLYFQRQHNQTAGNP